MHRVKKIHKLFYLAKKEEKRLGFNDCDCMFPQMLSGLSGLELRWLFFNRILFFVRMSLNKKKVHTSPNCLGVRVFQSCLFVSRWGSINFWNQYNYIACTEQTFLLILLQYRSNYLHGWPGLSTEHVKWKENSHFVDQNQQSATQNQQSGTQNQQSGTQYQQSGAQNR